MSFPMNLNRKSRGTVTVHVNVDRDIVDVFERLYPRLRTSFIRNCMKLAVSDKDFFDRAYFSELLFNS